MPGAIFEILKFQESWNLIHQVPTTPTGKSESVAFNDVLSYVKSNIYLKSFLRF